MRYLLVFLLLAASVSAQAAFTSTSTKGFKGSNWNGSGTISGGTAQTIETVNVGGKYISVPMLGQVGATALEMGIAVMKVTPASVIGSIAGSWLLSNGIKYLNGQLFGQKQSVPATQSTGTNGYWSTQQGVQNSCSGSDPLGVVQCACPTCTNWQLVYQNATQRSYTADHPTYGQVGWGAYFTQTCSSGQIFQNGSCVAEPSPCPADYTYDGSVCWPNVDPPIAESDWDRIRGIPTPDAVMKELCANMSALGTSNYACPANNVKAAPVTVPLSDWVTDPTTGIQTRQIAKLNPSPTTEDPQRVQVDLTTETKTPAVVDPQTGQTTQPENTTETPSTDKDQCTLHPDSIGCSGWGEPEDIDLETKDLNVSITPDSGFGPSTGTCPADLTYTLHNGWVFRMSYGPICTMADILRPLILALAWFAAASIFVTVSRRHS